MDWNKAIEISTERAKKHEDKTCELRECKFACTDDSEENYLATSPKEEKGTLLRTWAMSQLCTKLTIPCTYVKRCPEELRGQNVNHWLERYSVGKDVLLRYSGGEIRAVLSDRYGILDDHEMIKALGENLSDELEVKALNQGDMMTHISLVDDAGPLSVTGPNGENFQVGMTIYNSEVGHHAFAGYLSVHRVAPDSQRVISFCSVAEAGVKRRHIGLTRKEFLEKVKALAERVPDFRYGISEKLTAAFHETVPQTDLKAVKSKLQDIFGKAWLRENYPELEKQTDLLRFTLADAIATEGEKRTDEAKVRSARLAGWLLNI